VKKISTSLFVQAEQTNRFTKLTVDLQAANRDAARMGKSSTALRWDAVPSHLRCSTAWDDIGLTPGKNADAIRANLKSSHKQA